MTRREFVQSAAWLASESTSWQSLSTATVFEPWQPGTLDIHHLAYGRGNSTFVLCPDGTTILIDAGTNDDGLDVSSAQKPNASVRPGEWIASYILRHMQAASRRELDYFLLTHLHPDHVGDIGPANPLAPEGSYRLTGLMDVAARVPIGKVIDRGFPDYSYPAPQQAPFALNYLKYMESRRASGTACERVQVGRRDQMRLRRDRNRYPEFVIRNLAANGEVWTGEGDGKQSYFPAVTPAKKQDVPSENLCSIAIRLSFGKFDYYTGGDLTCDTEETDEAWRDIETPVARACGPVDVAVANHHSYLDAVGPEFVRVLQPRVFIVPTWYVAHPSILPLRRMLSRHLYKSDRDVYATSVMDANRAVNNQFLSKLKSVDGHVIVRVAGGGESFRVVVCDNSDDTGRVKATGGPFACT